MSCSYRVCCCRARLHGSGCRGCSSTLKFHPLNPCFCFLVFEFRTCFHFSMFWFCHCFVNPCYDSIILCEGRYHIKNVNFSTLFSKAECTNISSQFRYFCHVDQIYIVCLLIYFYNIYLLFTYIWCPVSYILDINRVPMSMSCSVSISDLVLHRKVACYVNNSVTNHYSDRAFQQMF